MVILPIRTDTTKVYGPKQGQWTHANWETLPEDIYIYEIINGVLYRNGSVRDWNYSIINRLEQLVGTPVLKQKIGTVFGTNANFLLPTGDVVVPGFGVLFGLDEEGPKATNIYLPPSYQLPALLVEIIAPNTSPYVSEIKYEAYARAGVPEYAIIDPAERRLKLYGLKTVGEYDTPKDFSGTQSVTFQCLRGISFHVNQLYDGAPDTTL